MRGLFFLTTPDNEDVAVLLAHAHRQAKSQRLGEALRGLGGPIHDPCDPERQTLRHEAIEKLGTWLLSLRPRERMAVELRFGLGADPGLTWRRLGEQLGVSAERARQIVLKALHKLGRQAIRTGFASSFWPPRHRARTGA